MSIFDIVLLCIIGGFAAFGLWFGLVHTIGSLVGTVLGVYLASRYYEVAANWLIQTTGWGANTSKVIIFVIVFFLINRLVGLAFWIVDKLLSIITHLPFISSVNRIFGAVFGALEGMIVLGIIFYFIARFPVGDGIMNALNVSKIAPYTIKIASILWPLVPDAIKVLQSTISNFK
ncbi:MAG: CvpA family protein [bacterium]|nr:CvpA family protein [bacterium]